MPETTVYEITADVSFTECFDVEKETPEEAKQFAKKLIMNDLTNGVIDSSAFTLHIETKEL